MGRPTSAEPLALMERAARAEGELAEARRVAAEALAAVTDAALDRAALRRVRALLAEMATDVETKGEEWHPRARAMAEQVIAQLAAALAEGEAQ